MMTGYDYAYAGCLVVFAVVVVYVCRPLKTKSRKPVLPFNHNARPERPPKKDL